MCYTCVKNIYKYQVINKSTAKKEYGLNENDLKNIRCGNIRNPVYRNSHPMILYLLKDIRKIAKRKHGSLKLYLKIKKEKEEIKNQQQKEYLQIQDEKCKKRKQILIERLSKNGLKLRPDSKLCEKYINGTLENMSCDDVVNTMILMHYLYNYTDYAILKQQQVNKLKTQHLTRDEWDEKYRQIDDNLQKQIIQRGLPKMWPWLEY